MGARADGKGRNEDTHQPRHSVILFLSPIFFYHHDGEESTEQRTSIDLWNCELRQILPPPNCLCQMSVTATKAWPTKAVSSSTDYKIRNLPVSLPVLGDHQTVITCLFLHLFPGLFYALDFQCHGLMSLHSRFPPQVYPKFTLKNTSDTVAGHWERRSKLSLFAEWIWVLTPVRYLSAMPISFTC